MLSQSEVIIQIDQSEGAALDWLVARVEQVQVFVSTSASGTMSCWRHDKPKQQFSPRLRWRECGPLLDKYDVTFSKHDGQIEAFCPTGPGNIQVSAIGPDRRTAACRAIVKSVFGNVAVIPFVLSRAHAEGAMAQGKTEMFDVSSQNPSSARTAVIISAREAAKPNPAKPATTTSDLIAKLTQRINEARAQGAKSVWVGPEDGYKPIGNNKRYQKPPAVLIEAFEALIQNEYFLEFEMRFGTPSVRVGFRPAEIGHPVNMDSIIRPVELSSFYRSDDTIHC